jgi:hypothetical protein
MVLLLALLFQEPAGDADLLKQVSESNLKATVERLVAFETRMCLSDAEDAKRGIGAAREWIKAKFTELAKGSKAEIKIDFHDWEDPSPRLARDGKRVPQKNVYAVVKGSKRPKEAIVFGAHYDSLNLRGAGPNAVAPGANDNGSGTAAVLEAFRILCKSPMERTVIFVCFAAEEQGLIGALHFANWLKEKAEYDVVGMLNNDIVGGAKDDDGKPLNETEIRCYSAPPEDSDSRRFARLAKIVIDRSSSGLKVLVKETIDRPGRGGDHQSFNKAGFTAIRLIEAVETDKIHHTPNDTVDRIHFPFHVKSTKSDMALLLNVANAAATPEPALDGTKLSWKKIDGADRYLVAIREGNDFVKTSETKELSIELDAGKPVCVASVTKEGRISLFSKETVR